MVKVLGVSLDDLNVYIILELMQTNLTSYLKESTVNFQDDLDNRVNLSLQIMTGIKYMHSKNVVHRGKLSVILININSSDLTTNNILLKNNN